MKRIISAAVLLSVAACSEPDVQQSESLGETSQDLNGALNPNGFLVRKNLAKNSQAPDPTLEAQRKQDTDQYYLQTKTDPSGQYDPIWGTLDTLDDFFTFYHFDSASPNFESATYYNRGDLGLGRWMQCQDNFDTYGQVACVVSNYPAGPDGTEFTFGQSKEIAFSNLYASPGKAPVATVAMVFSKSAPANQKMIFVVYNGAGKRVDAAPLDRHALNFENEFTAEGAFSNTRPDANSFGVPGTNFSSHIPSNCLNCHGGTYDSATHAVTGAFFLPFDLDQFDFQDVAGRSRADQLGYFRHLNEMVRKVDVAAGGTEIVNQLDTWYTNTSHSTHFANQFDSNQVPPGWSSNANDIAVYRSVVRPSCRGCHTASSAFPFDKASVFASLATTIQQDICQHKMPHSLQSQRQFWLTQQEPPLEAYFRTLNQPAATAAADALHGCGPDTIVTLDPQFLLPIP